MSHIPNTPAGIYPVPVDKNIVPSDDAVATLAAYATELVTKNNVFTREKTFGNKAENRSMQSSLYGVIEETEFHKGNDLSLKTLVEDFKKIDSEVNEALDTVFFNETFPWDQQGNSHAPKKISKGTKGLEDFVFSIVENTLKHSDNRNVPKFKLLNSTLLKDGNDPTTNRAYRNEIASSDTVEQVYSADRQFTSKGGILSPFDIAEISGVGKSQLQATLAMIPYASLDISSTGDNAVVNFFAGIAREFKRRPEKLLRFETNNILLHLHNPNIVNPDADTVAGKASKFISDLLSLRSGDEKDDRPLRGNVNAITRRMGPSLLSLIPDFTSFTFGKGKLYNPLALAGGGSLTFGEQLIPGTGHSIDSMTSESAIAASVGLEGPLAVDALDAIALGRTSEIRDKENLEPKSVIARLENPKHLGRDGKGKRVLSSVGKNRWQIKNLPDSMILRSVGSKEAGSERNEGTKPYISTIEKTTLSEIDVAKIEQELESEYVPFYFHDMRTNEIIAFYAFLKNISETYSPSWQSEQYYGRVDDVHIYGGSTRRTINLGFTIAALNRIDFDMMWKKVNKLVTLVYPQFGEPIKTNNNKVIAFSEPIVGAPLIRLRLGDLFKTNFSKNSEQRNATREALNTLLSEGTIDPAIHGKELAASEKKSQLEIDFSKSFGKGLAGIITDLSFDYNQARWETVKGHVAPQLIDVTFSFIAIHDVAPGLDKDGVNRAPLYTPVREKVKSLDAIFFNSKGPGSLDYTMTKDKD